MCIVNLLVNKFQFSQAFNCNVHLLLCIIKLRSLIWTTCEKEALYCFLKNRVLESPWLSWRAYTNLGFLCLKFLLTWTFLLKSFLINLFQGFPFSYCGGSGSFLWTWHCKAAHSFYFPCWAMHQYPIFLDLFQAPQKGRCLGTVKTCIQEHVGLYRIVRVHSTHTVYRQIQIYFFPRFTLLHWTPHLLSPFSKKPIRLQALLLHQSILCLLNVTSGKNYGHEIPARLRAPRLKFCKKGAYI